MSRSRASTTKTILLILSAWTVWSGVSSAAGDYQPPDYPLTASALAHIGIEAPGTLKAGQATDVVLAVRITRPLESPRRLFVHLMQDDKAYQVAIHPDHPAEGIAPAALKPGETLRFGPLAITPPTDLPPGSYRLVAGMYLERRVAEKPVTIESQPHDGSCPLIINTGTFIDKHGVPHRWHVNRAHTLFWDGEPCIPVGGMMIPDENLDTFKAQIDLLARHAVRDVYFNVGHSIMMPHTWETKSDEKLRLFQRQIDYMDEKGIRYGMELSGLQAHGYAYDLMGGRDVTVTRQAEDQEPRLEHQNDDQWLKEAVLCVAVRKASDAFYLIEDRTAGRIVAHGRAEIIHDDRKDREGRERGPEHQVARVRLPELPPGEYRIMLTIATCRESWNANMHFWGEDTEKYYRAIRELYGKIRMGPGFRFFVDAFWNENNFNHGVVPAEKGFRERYARWLQQRYRTIDKLRAAWAVEDPEAIADFDQAGRCLPLRTIRDPKSDVGYDCLIDVERGQLVRVRQSTSQHRCDIVESIGRQVRDFHIEVADLLKGLHGVPVVFKFFSGVDWWHINDAAIAGGHDGVGMETYGVAEPMLTFMGIPAFSSVRQATKTMWLLATEIGEGNHQDAALARNKLFGCTSRLGTMYPIYASLLAGGAKGLYHYYMVPSPGADRFWDDALIRDPRQIEWIGTFARIVENAPGLVDYAPTAYYRFPAIFHVNSGLLYSDPYRDYYNTDCLWWVDPAGKLPNGAWLLPTFTLDVPTDHLFINLENAPATLRYTDAVEACLKQARRITWLGYRKDRGTFPKVDTYYTGEFARDDDGLEFQVLAPTPECRVVARNRDGQVWNLIAGNLQIISKNAENRAGWRPQQVVLDGQNHSLDYGTFMKDRLGATKLDPGPGLEGISYLDRGRRVTVLSLEPELDKLVRLGDQFPAWGVDGTGNRVPVPPMRDHDLTFRLPSGATVRYASGEEIPVPADGRLRVRLRADDMTLIKSDNRFAWAREGLLFNTLDTRAAVIITSDGTGDPILPDPAPARHGRSDRAIRIEAERPASSNFNLDTFSGLAGLSGDGLLGLATQVPPPSPDGYAATYEFEAPQEGAYRLRVREGYLVMASPGRWRIDDGPWREATNAYVPDDLRLVTQYNALEDERMLFAWYDYGSVELSAGMHRFTYGVIEKRPGGLDIGLANNTPYGKLLDCFEFIPIDGNAAPAAHVKLILLCNPSLEEDTGGWTATEWTGDRWKWFELRDEQGWNRDFWWTRRVPGEGRIFIDGLMDIGGMQVRQSYGGVRSLRIRAAERPRRFSAEAVAVTPGESLVFGGYLRTEILAGKADLRLRFLDREGREIATSTADALSGDTHWQPVEATAVAPARAAQAILDCYVHEGKTGLTRYGRSWHDTAWFDDLYLYRSGEAQY